MELNRKCRQICRHNDILFIVRFIILSAITSIHALIPFFLTSWSKVEIFSFGYKAKQEFHKIWSVYEHEKKEKRKGKYGNEIVSRLLDRSFLLL